jgi:hypothetical protein
MSDPGENPILDECLESAISLVDLALNIQFKYFSVSGGPDIRMNQWSARSNSLLYFALATCYCVACVDGSEHNYGVEAIKALTMEFSEYVNKQSGKLHIPGAAQCEMLPNFAFSEPSDVLRSSFATFVDRFCPILPDQGESSDSIPRDLIKVQAHIVRPAESSDHGVVLEFDCRLPFRMELDLVFTNTPLPLPRYRLAH